jgi:hypothetical protein
MFFSSSFFQLFVTENAAVIKRSVAGVMVLKEITSEAYLNWRCFLNEKND